MEMDFPEDDFLVASIFYLVIPATQESAAFLQRILKSKEYDPDGIFNQYFLCFVHIAKNLNQPLFDIVLGLLQNLRKVQAPPILSKKLMQALEAAGTSFKSLINVPEIGAGLHPYWKELEPESLDVFCKVFALELNKEE
jgi:hypothetical protein